ncbi:MAG TPA: hypothetical protein VN033_13030 [Vulgatibacter sp.]|nr:hypothetical protein [Vulgatibacter sp.]
MDRTLLHRAIRFLGFLVVSAGAHLAHVEAQAHTSTLRDAEPLPNGAALRIASGGHATSIADLYWLKLVQYVGTPGEESRGWPHLEPLADLVVTVDPLFGYAYEASGVVLSSVGRYEASNAILERGMEHVPGRWQLPFFAGFNHWSALGDLDRGAALVLRASRIPGSPRYLPDLASRLFSSAGTIEEGIAALDATVASTSDPELRKEFLRRRDQLEMERALRLLEAAIADHRAREGAPPASLADLADPEARRIARSPLSENIDFEPSTGSVSSPLLPRRLMVYRPPAVPEALAAP